MVYIVEADMDNKSRLGLMSLGAFIIGLGVGRVESAATPGGALVSLTLIIIGFIIFMYSYGAWSKVKL